MRPLPRFFNKYEEAEQFGLVGKKLARKRGFKVFEARMQFLFATMTFWTRNVRASLDNLHLARQTAIKTGDLAYLAYCSGFIEAIALSSGMPLPEWQQLREKHRSALSGPSGNLHIKIPDQFKSAVLGLSAHLGIAEGAEVGEREIEEAELERNLKDKGAAVAALYYGLALQTQFITCDYDGALATCLKLTKLSGAHTLQPLAKHNILTAIP